MSSVVIVLSLLSSFYTVANALEFECKLPGDRRFLRVEIPGDTRLCEVSVTYEYTGERRVMWYAENDSLFCSARAYELKKKYENQWGFICERWPDRDGVDYLSESQRRILDQRLYALRLEREEDKTQEAVNAIKAVASTPLNSRAGLLVIQYFLDSGDRTELIEDNGESWRIISQFNNLSNFVVAAEPISLAVIESIADNGALQVSTRLSSRGQESCIGQQVLLTGSNSAMTPLTDHQFFCNDIAESQ